MSTRQTTPFNGGPLSLTNDGRLTLFFLGVGSAFSKRLFQTNLLIVKGDDHLLVDCGTRGPMALNRLGIPITSIRHFLITHSHADHIGGLEEAALLGRYVVKQRPRMVINEAYQHILWDMSLRGGVAYNEENSNDILGFTDFFEVIRPVHLDNYPRETLETQVGSIRLKMFRTKHIPNNSQSWASSFWSCGLIIDDRVLFTSDTRYDEDLLVSYDKLFGLEAVFHDCQFHQGGVHASLEELNQLPAGIKAKTYLTHYGDDWENHEKTVHEYGFPGLARQQTHYRF